MGTLRELTSNQKNVHMLITDSNIIELYVYDTLKKVCGASSDSIVEVNNSKEFSTILDLVNLYPLQADKWLFIINYSKIPKLVEKNKGIFESDSSCFLIKVSRYSDYKAFKEICPKVNDLYLSIIRQNEISYLLYEFGLSQKLVDFVAKSYSRDPEKVFILRKDLASGLKVQTQKDIVNICGTSAGSINYFAILLLADPPKTKRGFEMVYKRRISLAKELIDLYGVSTLRNYLSSTVYDILQIKILYMVGVIYDSIKDLPEITNAKGELVYDEKRLSRYNMYLKRIINEIPYSRILRLNLMLKQNRWYKQADMLEFIYNYYGGLE